MRPARTHGSPINISAFVMDVFVLLLRERGETWSRCYKSLACSSSPHHMHTHACTCSQTHAHRHTYTKTSIGIASWGSHSLTLQQTHSPSSHIHMCRVPPPSLCTAWGGEILLPYEEEEHIINYTHALLHTQTHTYAKTHLPLIPAGRAGGSNISRQYFCIFLCQLHLDRWH